MKNNQIIVCPGCKRFISTARSCRYCGAYHSKLENDVHSFIKDTYYWGEIPPKDMQAVLQDARRKGWRKAVLDLTKTYPKMEEYLLNHARIDWIFHALPKDTPKSCLDIGSGWGGLAFDLVPFFDEVYSLEAVRERFEFQRIRKKQEGTKKLKLVQGSFLKLPFADNSFDMVAVNGVLEWAGIADYSKPAPQVQQDFLNEVYRVLKPGGVVYIGIENRFGLHYLLGAEDHSGLPFTSIMPRFFADLTVRHLRKTEGKYKLQIRMEQDWKDYRTYTYTLDGYKKLLSSSQFKIVDPYWTLFYSNPKFSGPIDGASFKFFLKYIASNTSGGKKSFGGLISKLGYILPEFLCKRMALWFAPSFLLYAYKKTRSLTLEQSIRQLAASHKSFLKMGGSSSETSKINYFFLNGKRLTQVAKFPRFSKAAKNLALEEKLLWQYGNVSRPKSFVIKNHKLPVFFEKPLRGSHPTLDNHEQSDKALDWLVEFQNKTKSGTLATRAILKDKAKLQDLITVLAISDKQKIRIRRNLDIFMREISDTRLPTCASHGDFCARNILINKDLVYVLDWEDYQKQSNPLLDFLFFCLHGLAHSGDADFVVRSFLNFEQNKLIAPWFAALKEHYNINRSALKHSVVYISLWYLHKFAQDSKHLGHGNFYISILSKVK